jgi:hypothetical protein
MYILEGADWKKKRLKRPEETAYWNSTEVIDVSLMQIKGWPPTPWFNQRGLSSFYIIWIFLNMWYFSSS